MNHASSTPRTPSTCIVPARPLGQLCLVVLGDELGTYPLPDAGTVTIGRSSTADIPIHERSISRHHAVLHVGDKLAIEDLDSANGTRVAGATIAPRVPTVVRQGEIIEVGEVSLLVQRRAAPPPRSRWAKEPEARVDLDVELANGFVVADPAMIQLRRVIERVASGSLSVLLLGETGVGKEGLAELVHLRSPRAGKPFLRLNCSAFTESLLESELFGHEKGAFTGAAAAKPGLLETAHGGTVFLDEIGEISPSLQVKLLRVLEDRVVQRVGGLKGTPIDVRFVAATNRDLEEEVAAGRFRQDLYYRLAGITLVVPPLRERKSEIAPLARSFIEKACAGTGRTLQLGADALELLELYSWPGNIRELRNVIDRAVLLCSDRVIQREHVPVDRPPPRSRRDSTTDVRTTIVDATILGHAGAAPPATPDSPIPPTLSSAPPAALEALYRGDSERDRIIAALSACRGNQTRAAEMLGMSRRTLINRVEEYALPRPRKGR